MDELQLEERFADSYGIKQHNEELTEFNVYDTNNLSREDVSGLSLKG